MVPRTTKKKTETEWLADIETAKQAVRDELQPQLNDANTQLKTAKEAFQTERERNANLHSKTVVDGLLGQYKRLIEKLDPALADIKTLAGLKTSLESLPATLKTLTEKVEGLSRPTTAATSATGSAAKATGGRSVTAWISSHRWAAALTAVVVTAAIVVGTISLNTNFGSAPNVPQLKQLNTSK